MAVTARSASHRKGIRNASPRLRSVRGSRSQEETVHEANFVQSQRRSWSSQSEARSFSTEAASNHENINENIYVGVRLRPLLFVERRQVQAVHVEGSSVTVSQDSGRSVSFNLDAVMDSRHPESPDYASQEHVYELFGKRMVDHAVEGYTSTIFAYGQTGTGKTTTMVGKLDPASEQGLVPRLARDIFESAGQLEKEGYKCNFSVQMLEVYNEQLHDLLAPVVSRGSAVDRRKPEVHVHPKLGVYVTDATEAVVETFNEVVQLLEYGNALKMIASTAMNRQSSRSHTIFKIHMEKRRCSDGVCTASDIYCVDLAGRENERTAQVAGQRLVELSFINRSLMWLAECIKKSGEGAHSAARSRKGKAADPVRRSSAPASSGRRHSIMFSNGQAAVEGGPAQVDKAASMSRFRNSKLTLLLANALSGNSRTAMIGTIGPSAAHVDESLSTLNFAATVKNIRMSAAPCSSLDKDALLQMLQKEVEQLRQQLKSARGAEKRELLAKRVESTENLSEQHTMSWDQKRRKSLSAMKIREVTMQRMGIARLDSHKAARPLQSQLPCLANESDDPHLCGMLSFHIPPDAPRYSVGATDDCDFCLLALDLCGNEARPPTCYFRNKEGRLKIWAAGAEGDKLQGDRKGHRRCTLPASGSFLARSLRASGISVNGDPVGQTQIELAHGDLVHIGRHAFRVNTRSEEQSQHLADPKRNSSESSVSSKESSDDSSDRTGHAARSRGTWEPGASGLLTSDAVAAALGEEAGDPGQLDAARLYCLQFQLQPGCAENLKALKGLLARLAEAQGLVAEANAITNTIKPHSSLRFGVATQCPVFSPGYGRHKIPDIIVRLEQHRPDEQESPELTEADSEGRAHNSKKQLLCVWTFEKFQGRLLLMRDAHASFLENPEGYCLDPLLDPWTEHGPAEIAELQEAHKESLAAVLVAQPLMTERSESDSRSTFSRVQSNKEGRTPLCEDALSPDASLAASPSGPAPTLACVPAPDPAPTAPVSTVPAAVVAATAPTNADVAASCALAPVPPVPPAPSLSRSPSPRGRICDGTAVSCTPVALDNSTLAATCAQGTGFASSSDSRSTTPNRVQLDATVAASRSQSPQRVLRRNYVLIGSPPPQVKRAHPGPQLTLPHQPPLRTYTPIRGLSTIQRHPVGIRTVGLVSGRAASPNSRAPTPPVFTRPVVSWGPDHRSAPAPVYSPIQGVASTCSRHRGVIGEIMRALDGFLVASHEFSVRRRSNISGNVDKESALTRKVREARIAFESELARSPQISATEGKQLRAEFEFLQTLADEILVGNSDRVFSAGPLTSLAGMNCFTRETYTSTVERFCSS